MYSRVDYQTLVQKNDFFGQFPLFVEIDVCGVTKKKEEEK